MRTPPTNTFTGVSQNGFDNGITSHQADNGRKIEVYNIASTTAAGRYFLFKFNADAEL